MCGTALGVSWWMESLGKSRSLATSLGTSFTMIPPRLLHKLSQYAVYSKQTRVECTADHNRLLLATLGQLSGIQCSTVQCNSIQFIAVQCSALQCSAVQCHVAGGGYAGGEVCATTGLWAGCEGTKEGFPDRGEARYNWWTNSIAALGLNSNFAMNWTITSLHVWTMSLFKLGFSRGGFCVHCPPCPGGPGCARVYTLYTL